MCNDFKAVVICLGCQSTVTVNHDIAKTHSTYVDFEDSFSISVYCPLCDENTCHSTLL